EPRVLHRRCVDAGRGEVVEVVPHEVVLVAPPVVDRERGRDVVPNVEVPRSALHELPVNERRPAIAVEVQVADVGIAGDDAPWICARGGRGEGPGRAVEAVGVTHLGRDAGADRALEVSTDLRDTSSRVYPREARREPFDVG